jgi:hypothetical protein
MKKAKIYTFPKKYIERQRIIKALQDPLHELVMWYYHNPDEDDVTYLFGVYLRADNTLCIYYYDIETLQRQGMGYIPGQTPGEELEPDVNNLCKWLHKEGGITDLFGYVLGVQSKPPKHEGKIIQFPAIKADRHQRSTA